MSLVYTLKQGSSTFQIVRATLTISMMPAGHKAIHDVLVHIIGKSGRSINLTTDRYIMCRQRAGLVFVVIFSKQPAGHGKGLRGPRVEDPCPKVSYNVPQSVINVWKTREIIKLKRTIISF
jgi:hypothetical protein